ncbi:1-deoxy-D-xylulose-5-phosphate reductoisomerase [Streptomyces sp. CB01881]|uniref:1-deoxy-D-xylulose-5-phosphate reductoisomerase n=1 Tax=Streptomyces sp. CB01881 TaxID=2078691 RepID=UPI000CDCA53E|nr:1-deoxy-D-xylulose-5-phosphate reductoisomerase [Streptomyces sp. CB01881]AUY53125.1 1-deoxy-D-xylulose-5-phosphate reductoisomerase [Streptomyces sp. CB01881]TYC69277.1 1-deoxy-D-xylulose-5-phosphate reductoisomerase [Streptomyces sp. CB01881]
MKTVGILGSTGSVGTQAVDVVRRNTDKFKVLALAAGGGRVGLLAEQVLDLSPVVVAVAGEGAADELPAALAAEASRRGLSATDWSVPKILSGPAGVEEVAAYPVDVMLNGITGALGLTSTLATLRAGTTLALANKESLIVGGELVKREARPGQIVPVDSEHSALAQALRAGAREEVRRLVLTATGGPFRGRGRAELADVTVAEALAHPTWSMGPVISINSATLVNKGLEVIEAHLLFDVPYEDILVMVHPQSTIHSMVEFVDGSTIAQVSPPDMRLPIALGLSWPERVPGAARAFDWTQNQSWELFPLDDEAFPSVGLARHVGSLGGSAPAVFNAANEVCVDAFLAGRLPFLSIVDTVARVVSELGDPAADSLETILAADAWARARAQELNGAAHR